MSGKVRLKEDGYLDEDALTLKQITLNYLCNNLNVISYRGMDGSYNLKNNINLPNDIWDDVIEQYQTTRRPVDDKFAHLFYDTKKTTLRHVYLRNSLVTNEGLEKLMQHKLISLSLWYCYRLTEITHQLLRLYGENLRALELGIGSHVLQNSEPHEKEPIDFQLDCPSLRHLVLNNAVLNQRLRFDHLKHLNHLDLTSCSLSSFSLGALASLRNLHTLILFNVWPIANQLQAICCLRSLRVLDLGISSVGNGNGIYDLPDQTLDMIMDNLRHLTHLDISGTNLAGNGVASNEYALRAESVKGTDIPGLASRIDRPLLFLGLYNTAHWACKRHDIPAIEIAGDSNEQQILTAARYYFDRPQTLTRVLNDLYHLLRFENCKNIHTALEVVLSAMDRHIKFKHMQISGSATLFYIVKGREKEKFGTMLRNHIIRTLLNGMEAHITDETMLRNGYLTLTQFQMPGDVLFEYKRLIMVLLHGVSKTEQEGFVQRIAIYLLNTLACQVDGTQKLCLGEWGVVSTMLSLIQDRLTRAVFDDVMEVAWSTMWNVTDETAINCNRFLAGSGMEFFLKCLRAFPNRDELLRNMMGLLGNVAEVQNLRPKLMTDEFIKVFSDLLDSNSDGIEVSYNAAGVLSHIASDGPEAWTIDLPKRNAVLNRMVSAIERWNINSERNINYRSFEPILYLVRCYETPQCQHWAVWALANLTKVYPEKYCDLVKQEKGIDMLTALIKDPRPYDRIKEIAQMVLDECKKWAERKNLD